MFDDKAKELRWKSEFFRRSRRRMKLPKMLARLRGRFEYLVASIRLPRVDIVGKSDMVLAVLENKKAVSTDGMLTAFGNRLPENAENGQWEERLEIH